MTIAATQPACPPRIYQLKHSLDRFQPENFDGPKKYAYDGFLHKFQGHEELATGFYEPVSIMLNGTEGIVTRKQDANGKLQVTEIRMPEQIRFGGDKDFLQETDFLYTMPRWPIMSKRMLEVLLSVRDFQHQVIPIEIEDSTLSPSETGWAKTGIVNHNYVILQLLNHLDEWDKGKPVHYETSSISGIALKEPEGGFPPIFRVSGNGRVPLYTSTEAKTALESAGIKGIKYDIYQLPSIVHNS
jgi:hypothetical protein